MDDIDFVHFCRAAGQSQSRDLSSEALLEMDLLFKLSERSKKSVAVARPARRWARTPRGVEEEDTWPLFYCLAKQGFYSPRQGKATAECLNVSERI